MPSFNKVIIMGNLTRDPELKVPESGISICSFGIATTRYYTTKAGEKREETTFVDVDCFGRQAEVISRYCSKGKPILIEGRLKLDQWESKTGEKRSKLSVVLESFQFVGGRQDETTYDENSPPSRSSSLTSNEDLSTSTDAPETSKGILKDPLSEDPF